MQTDKENYKQKKNLYLFIMMDSEAQSLWVSY